MFIQAILELQSEKYLKSIDEDAVLGMDQKDKSLFVFSSFTTPAFLHCKKVQLLFLYIEPQILQELVKWLSWRLILLFLTRCLSCSLAAES